MVNVDLIGTFAGVCTTAAFAPQAIRVWKSRSVGDISLSMYIMFCGGLAMWLVYGWQIQAWPIILTNGVTLLLAGSVLTMKVIFQAPAQTARRNLRGG